jgi:hypothetical protein
MVPIRVPEMAPGEIQEKTAGILARMADDRTAQFAESRASLPIAGRSSNGRFFGAGNAKCRLCYPIWGALRSA